MINLQSREFHFKVFVMQEDTFYYFERFTFCHTYEDNNLVEICRACFPNRLVMHEPEKARLGNGRYVYTPLFREDSSFGLLSKERPMNFHEDGRVFVL